MNGPTPNQEDFKSLQESKSDTTDFKRRKVVQKSVVAVKVEANAEKQRGVEGPPSDSWSWRKYGQKPIKGSPYPRGYYRCSTSKGCSAKKQVERCRTDASVLIITYTSDHNHPGPDLPSNSLINQSPALGGEEAHGHLGTSDEVCAIPCSKMVTSSASKTCEENDFFDELEELPISSSFTGSVRSSFFDERILLLPS